MHEKANNEKKNQLHIDHIRMYNRRYRIMIRKGSIFFNFEHLAFGDKKQVLQSQEIGQRKDNT